MQLNEVRKEDDIYFCGPFWIIADSKKDILKGNFKLLCKKSSVDYNGNFISPQVRRSLTHKEVWELLGDGINSYTYYPRGRVGVFEGEAYINLNSFCNIPKVIDAIAEEYNIKKLGWDDINIELDDINQGSHYGFGLE